MTLFDRLEIGGWRQFQQIDLDLTNPATILTGTNGAGKTTILSVLSRHFGWNLTFVSTPYMGKRRAKRLWSDVYDERVHDFVDDDIPNDQIPIGKILYSNGAACTLTTNRYVDANYHVDYVSIQSVPGIYIPSHRPVAVYHSVPTVPTNPITVQQQYQQYQNLLFQVYGGATSRQNPGVIQKQSIIALALFGEGNSAVSPNLEYARVFAQLQEILRIVLPPTLGFIRLEVRMPEVVLVTRTGDFALDAMSGGINALFGIAWQIFMHDVEGNSRVVIIDEPENHLHPTMQRRLLPSLSDAFPSHRFIAATHSPFIVSSFPAATVYALHHNEQGRVVSTQLKANDISGTPNRILREILDVESNLPIWVEERIQAVINGSADQPPEDRARTVMSELARLGISDSLAEFIGQGNGE